jgi:hypothetical protein
MRLLKKALKDQRWDLAAHTIVLAAVNHLGNGGKPSGSNSKAKKRSSKG